MFLIVLYIRKLKSTGDVFLVASFNISFPSCVCEVFFFPLSLLPLCDRDFMYFRVRSGTCASDSKAHREKMRRDKLNDRQTHSLSPSLFLCAWLSDGYAAFRLVSASCSIFLEYNNNIPSVWDIFRI